MQHSLIVDKSTKCAYADCASEIPAEGWKYAAVAETSQGGLIFCCVMCRVQAGYGGTSRICKVIPEGVPAHSTSSKKPKILIWWILVVASFFFVNTIFSYGYETLVDILGIFWLLLLAIAVVQTIRRFLLSYTHSR